MPKKMPALSQNAQQNSNPRSKCSGENMIWLGLKFCGSGSNISPKLIYFESMFLGVWLTLTSK